jgi:HK97 family phage major capsid protein
MANRYKALLNERAELVAESQALFGAVEKEARDMTDEERARDDQIAARMGAIAGDLEREERRRQWEREVEPVSGGTPVEALREPAQPRRLFGSLGEQLMAVRQAAQPGGRVDPRLLEMNAAALGGNAAVPSDGGFLLEAETTSGLWQRAYDQGELLRRTFKVPIGENASSVKINGIDETSRATGSRWGGVRAYWLAEAGSLTGSRPRFKQLEYAPKKLAVLVYATDEMLRNPATLEGVVNQVVPQEIAWMSEDAIIRGDGAGKPLGILGSAALIPVAAEANQGAATIVSENISKMWARMWARSRANALWLVNQDIEPQLDMLTMQVGVGGVPTYMPPGGLSEAPYGRLKGRPVMPMEYCSTLGTIGDIILADLNQYAISDRGSIKAASSIHVQFLTDETAFRFIYEIDGQSLWSTALTPANGTNTLSPFVALATRS